MLKASHQEELDCDFREGTQQKDVQITCLSFRSGLFIKASTAFIPIASPTLSSSGPEAVLSLVYMYIYIIHPREREREGGREGGGVGGCEYKLQSGEREYRVIATPPRL